MPSTSARWKRSSWPPPAEYGERKGITYAAWREAGVDPGVLRKAGIKRGAE